ncbi:uncharacterized protein LOC141915180 [Tubulanus polymorphus]|uniref:uncharacterized protein LOC141915180 n=1 Tax=Tubulanus polymorphus TaxID=672921 RepID=UPI003DA620ED
MDISMEISRSPSTPSTVVDTGCGESVISVKQEPVWVPEYSVIHSTIPPKMPETILPADVSSNVINQQPPVTCASVNENPDTVQNSPIPQMPQIASNIMANHPTFSELSVLNKATSVLTMSGNNRGNLDLQHIDPPTAMNTSQDSNQSMSQVLQITLREEQIRNNLNVIHSHVDRCKTLLRETQKEIEYFTNLHEFLIKEEVNLRQQRLNILKGAVGNASTSSIQTPILISSPQTNRAIHDDSITSQSANDNTLPSAESNNNNKNVTMEYVGTLQSQVAAEKLLHELSSNSQEMKSSTPQPGVFAVPEPVLSDINTDTELNRDSTYLKPKKKQTSVRSKSTDSSMTDESSASTSSSTITKKKQSKKKSDKKKLEKNMKLQKKKKSKKAAKMNNDDDNVDISFLYQSSSATDTDSTVQEKADSEKRADYSSDISRGGESRSNADIPPDMALEILSDKRSHKEKFKAILLDSVDTTMQISNTWEDPDCIFLDKISPYQMETDTSALNTPTSVMSSQLSSVGNSSRYPVVVLNRIDEASKQEKIAQFKDDLLQIPDSSPNTTKKKRTKKKKKIQTDSNMGSTSSLADSSTESFNDISRHDSRNAGNLKVSRDLLVEAGVIFTNSDAEQMLSDSTVIKSEDDDHSIVSSSNLTEKNSLQLDLSTPKSATKVIRSVKESYSSLATPGEFLGHSMPIFCMQVSGGFLYSCSQDASIRKYDLKTHACVLKFSGHTKAVHCLSVTSSPEDLLFTGGFDNMLIIHSSKTATILDKFEMDSKLHCMHSAWGKLYIGLEDGCVHCFDFKSNSVIDTFRCSDRPISAITSTREGIRRLLLVGSYDTLITVRDANSWLLLRTIEAHDKTPLSIRVHGSQIFSTSNDYTVKVHDLYTAGHVYTFPKFPGAMTSLAVHKDVILAAGFDGLIRCYDIKTFQLLALYYGAGKTLILDMLVYNNMIFTANRHGVIEAISFNPKVVFPCNVIGCKLKFGLTCDLLYHVTEAHLPATSTSTGVKCPWNGCYLMLILGSNAREHIAHHIEDLDDDSLSNLSS